METTSRSTTVLLADDVASAPPAEEREKRRGVAGMVYAFKIAGAKAEEGRPRRRHAHGAEGGRRLPLDRRGAHALHGAAGRQAHLRDRRGRDGDGHGHPRRAGHLARQAPPGRRHRRRDDGPPARRPCRSGRATAPRCWSTASARPRPRSSTSSTGRARPASTTVGVDARHAAGRPLRHLDGDGGRDGHADAGSTTSSSGFSRRPATAPSGACGEDRRWALPPATRPAAGASPPRPTSPDRLNAADGQLGDGDLGITVARGWQEVARRRRSAGRCRHGVPRRLQAFTRVVRLVLRHAARDRR